MAEKVGEYLRLGSERAWIIDPRNRTLHVFSPDSPPREYTPADVLTDETVLPGFSCKVSEVFES